MQRRGRETRCLKGLRRYGKPSLAGLGQRIIYFFLLVAILFCVSCAHHKTLPPQDLKTVLNNACWSGEGKGKIRYYKEQYHFRFESVLQKDKQTWGLGLNLPVIGQEILRLNYNAPAGTTGMEGSLWKRWQREMAKDPNGELTKIFKLVRELYSFLVWYHATDKKNCQLRHEDATEKWQCPGASADSIEVVLSDKSFSIVWPLFEYTAYATFEDWQNNQYREMQLIIQQKNKTLGDYPPLEIKLWFDSCP